MAPLMGQSIFKSCERHCVYNLATILLMSTLCKHIILNFLCFHPPTPTMGWIKDKFKQWYIAMTHAAYLTNLKSGLVPVMVHLAAFSRYYSPQSSLVAWLCTFIELFVLSASRSISMTTEQIQFADEDSMIWLKGPKKANKQTPRIDALSDLKLVYYYY